MPFYLKANSMAEPEPDTITWERLRHDVTELAGRNLPASVWEQLRRKNSVYVATAPGSPGRARFGRGFIVFRQNDLTPR